MKSTKRFDKKLKKERKIKKSRLIIRNLSFKISEDEIKNVFSKYGNIVEISLPKKENGKLKGFAFLSYDNVGSSLKAIKYINGKEVGGRVVAVDFSISKKDYIQHSVKNEDETNETENNNETLDSEVSDDENCEEYDEENEEVEKFDNVTKSAKSRKYSDVIEEKTLFIRNLDLETTEESLTELLSSFGTLDYCKICMDEYTDKSKGTAFAKFKNKEDAQACIDESSIPDNPKLYIDGHQLSITLAVPRNKVSEIQEFNQMKHKDKRNLYLSKEGLIYPNSPASVGVSQSDLKKRLMLEEKKRKLLQNYHYFISDRRLCIHNLPPSYDDKKLRKLFLESANDKKAQILWAKVMRNRSKVDNKFGNSKGFGFVEFSEHSHAIKALRHLNNNPDIFTNDKRPIVEFSVENKVALNRKKYRLIKQEKMINNKVKDINNGIEKPLDGEQSNYSGVMAKPLVKGDKVIQPKMNRKMSIVKKDLVKRGKELKVKQAKKKNSDKHKVKMAKNSVTPKRKFDEEDKFDSHYKKRKNVFVSNESNIANVKQIKTKKWFNK